MRAIFLLIILLLVVVDIKAQGKWDFVGVNSVYDEQNPVLSSDEKTLYFVRANHPENTGGKKDKGDIWISTWGENGWSVPVNAGKPLNNLGYNGTIGFLNDGSMLLYGNYASNGSSTHGRGISVSKKAGDSWSTPKNFEINYYFNKAEHNGISLSKNGRTMLLSIESYGTVGGEDIYVSFLAPDGKWSQPQNLGTEINTRYQEMTPVLAPDGKTLFFASNGWPGYGSRDIFVSKRLDDSWRNWSEPVNLGTNVNTEGKELSFYFVDEQTAVYTSTVNSDGYGDVKSVVFSQEDADSLNEVKPQDEVIIVDLQNVTELKDDPMAVLHGLVANASTGEHISASITVTYAFNSEVKDYNVSDGKYSIELNPGHYLVQVESPGFISREEQVLIDSSGVTSPEMDFNLYPIEVGRTIQFDHVNFQRSTSELIETSYTELDLVVKMMNENPSMEIALAGHTDNQGSSRLNIILSQERVDIVKKYLVDHGIDSKRISGKGFGGSRPIASNASEETRKLNRRVEFTIVKN